MAEWFTVVLEPVAENPAGSRSRQNRGGVAVSLSDGDETIEVTRVAFARRHSRNPDAEFADQLDEEVAKAQAACDRINEHLDEAERARAEALDEIRAEVRSILGRKPTKPA